MGNFKQFFKENKIAEENRFFAPTKSLVDENGEPLKWEFQKLTSKEMDALRDRFTKEVPVPGKPGMYRSKVDINAMNRWMVVESVVYPDLNSEELQDNYGVKFPDELLMEMVDDPGENTNLIRFVSELNGFSLEEMVEEVKN